MKGYFKLIDGIKQITTIPVARTRNGMTQTSFVELHPGRKYVLEDDEKFIESLKLHTISKRKTPELEEFLKSSGIAYEEHVCKQCNGRIQKLKYHSVEVVIVDG